MINRDPAERSLGDLFRDLSQQATTLIRQEMQLARTEVSERAGAWVSDGIWIGAGVVLLQLALGTAVAAIVLGLVAAGISPAVGAGLVAAVLLVVGAVIVQFRVSAIRRRRMEPLRSIHSIKETARWLKHEATS